MNASRLRGAAIAGVLALLPAVAQAWFWVGPQRETLAALSRGVNLSGWLQFGREDPAYAPATEDWRRLRALGLTHVRIPFDPAVIAGGDGLTRPEALARLRGAVEGAASEGLTVVLAMQLPPPSKQRLGRSPADRAALKGLWQAVALTLADLPPQRLLLEPVNEYELDDAALARKVQGELLQALRETLPKHTLVAAGPRWSSVDDLAALEPYRDRNLVYTFHFYDPHAFTHQGATWGDPAWRELANIPYPSSPERVAPLLASLAPELARIVRWHGEQRWDAARLGARVEAAARWGREHSRPVWCGEFGVRRDGVDPAQRADWLRDARRALEARGIGWSMWDYRGGFGLYTATPGGPELDPLTADALGLRRP